MAGKGNILSFDEVRNTTGRTRPSTSTSKTTKRNSLKAESARPSKKGSAKASAPRPASAKTASPATSRAATSASARTNPSRKTTADRKSVKQAGARPTQGAKTPAKPKPKAASGSLFPKKAVASSVARPKAGNSGSLGSPLTRGKAGASAAASSRTKPGNSGRIGAPLPRSKNSQGFEREAEQQREHSAQISKFSEIKKKRSKSKAGKAFSKQFGDTTSSAASGGPRAALYKGEMGSTHKKSARMQESAMSRANTATRGFALPIPHISLKKSPKTAVGLMVAVCVVLSMAFLYAPTQQYYIAVRERDQLQAEYAALEQRNATIQSEVDYLSTEEGIEDRAREQFGWVKEGENSVTVYGLADSIETDANYTKQIEPGSVAAPEDWFTPFCDALFGYDGNQ